MPQKLAPPAAEKRCLLLVEDDEGVRRSLQLMLGGRGFQIAAYDAAEPLLADPLTDTVALLKHLAIGRTLVVVEHDMDALFNMADQITVLSQGRILAEGTPAQVQKSPAVQDAYLGGVHE